MATTITAHRTTSLSASEVQARLDAALVADGATPVDGWLTITRSIEVPAALAAFVSGPLTVVGRRQWNGSVASTEIRVKGQPVQAIGTLTVAETEGGCAIDVALVLSADVPFVGAMVESAVKPEIVKNIEHELASITD